MKIYTKTGDKGTTSLLGGTRVPKHHIRINAYGTVDELNSYIGLLRDLDQDVNRKNLLKEVQDRLFTMGSSLAAEKSGTVNFNSDIQETDILRLENAIDEMNNVLPEMRNFILPGGHTSVSFAHITRCVCRRAERLVIELSSEVEIDEGIIRYLNRLSDFLFVLARKLGQELHAEEIAWKPRG